MPLNRNKPEESTPKRKVNERSSTSSNDTSFESSQPVLKKQTVKNPQEKAPKGNDAKKTQTGENDKVQQKITSFQTAKGGGRADNQDPILKELTTLGTMVLEINTKMNSMITKEEFQNKFEKLVTKSDLEKVVDRVKREITTEMTEKMDKLESRIFELEIKNDDLYKENENLREQIQGSREYIEDVDYGVHMALKKTNDLEQYTRKSSVRIFGLEDEKNEEIAITIAKVNNLLNDKLHMDTKESDINIAHRLGPYTNKKCRPVIVRFMSRQHKIETIKKRKALAKSRYVIKEDLTKENENLVYELQNSDNVEAAWSNEGKIFVKIQPSGAIIRIFHDTDLTNLQPPKNWRPRIK